MYGIALAKRARARAPSEREEEAGGDTLWVESMRGRQPADLIRRCKGLEAQRAHLRRASRAVSFAPHTDWQRLESSHDGTLSLTLTGRAAHSAAAQQPRAPALVGTRGNSATPSAEADQCIYPEGGARATAEQ